MTSSKDGGHRYTFHGFDGPYWEKKAEREALDDIAAMMTEHQNYDYDPAMEHPE